MPAAAADTLGLLCHWFFFLTADAAAEALLSSIVHYLLMTLTCYEIHMAKVIYDNFRFGEFQDKHSHVTFAELKSL